ncbi:MAG TPA: DUF5989 family protein [Polyangiaceae bacterium]
MDDKKTETATGFAREFVGFVQRNKKLWLIPLVLIALVVLLALALAQSGALAPFMYSPS